MADYESLKEFIRNLGGVAIGYSGGVDSTLLSKAATDALGDRALCVLIESALTPESEIAEANEIAEELGFNLVTIRPDILALEEVLANERDRCYHCKKALFTLVIELARERGLPYVLDGANLDDEGDFRPGSQATAELAVRSPFKELGFTKERIRAVSRDLGLPTWNKPSYACLASRVPYGTRLSEPLLKRIEDAETALRNMGFTQFRVRHHGDVARIELMPIEMDKMMMPVIRSHVVDMLKGLGYRHVALDLAGYRMGSMNFSADDEG